jgi:hypothetical protein
MSGIRKQHEKSLAAAKQNEKSLASIKQKHEAETRKLREDKKGDKKMGIIEKNVLMKSLKENILDVTFKKMDGSIRMMKCTLRPDYLPPGASEEEQTTIHDYSSFDIDGMYHFCGDKPDRWASAMSISNPDFTKISLHTWLCQWLPHVIESSVAARKTYDKSQIIRVWELSSGWRSFYLDRVTSVQMATP